MGGEENGKEKGEQAIYLFPLFTCFPGVLYAGAGLPPVIGGIIGFSGFAAGSFNCGRSSSPPESDTGGFSSNGKPATIRRISTASNDLRSSRHSAKRTTVLPLYSMMTLVRSNSAVSFF